MRRLKSACTLLGILTDDGRLSMTNVLIWLWLIRMSFDQSLDAAGLWLGVIVLFFWGIQLGTDLYRQRKLTEEERQSIENLSNRLSAIEAALALSEQRRMF